MSQITVVRDPELEFSDIVVTLSSPPKEYDGDDPSKPNLIKQTQVYGIEAPLIAINKTVIDFMDVVEFKLECTGKLPTIDLIVRDRYQLISTIDTPRLDNELRIQILPKFENAYKKINLTFYISNIRVNGDNISLSGIYKVPDFLRSNFKALGEIDTYQLFDTAATETKLGLASNIEEDESDKRFIYMDNKSWKETLLSEIEFANSEEKVLDWWIDWWNYINLVDVRERYNTIDPEDELQIWVAGMRGNLDEGYEYEPQQVRALLTNHPANQNSELYVKDFEIAQKPGLSVSRGTDRVYGVYEMSKEEYMDHLIQDGDIQDDIFVKTEYLGEVYGDYNYFLSRELRATYLQKIDSTTFEITLDNPLLALMRGHKVDVAKYINNTVWSNKVDMMQKEGYAKTDDELIKEIGQVNISLDDTISEPLINSEDQGQFEMDKSVSGQYLIVGCKLRYFDGQWHYIISLSRPADQTVSVLKEED